MAEDLIGTIRLLTAEGTPLVAAPERSPSTERTHNSTNGRVDGRVLRLVRNNPPATWRVVKERTGLSEANAKRVLTSAQKKLRDPAAEAPEALEPIAGHPNGRSS